MTPPRKTRSDSPLRNLPPAKQEELYLYANTHSLAEGMIFAKRRYSVPCSMGSLSGFLSWYALRQQLKRNDETVCELLRERRKEKPDMTEEEIFLEGQAFFTALAIEQRDSESWKRIQDAFDRRKLSEQNDRKLALMEKKQEQADAAQKVSEDSTLTAEEKQARIRQIFGLG